MTIIINVSNQTLSHFDNDDNLIRQYPISTAKKGTGEKKNSFKTPRGAHKIRAKIGTGCPMNTIFIARRPAGILDINKTDHKKDWILTRILWLSGLELGLNRLGDVDTMQRYIYIHGTSDERNIGKPVSHGCIRMLNENIVTLYDLVTVGEMVHIKG